MSDEQADAAEVVMSPAEAARRLGVSPSGLRRLAGVYGAVFTELPKDSSGTSRVWPQQAVGRLERARALLAAGQARSIADGLRAVEGGAQPSLEAALALSRDGRVVEALGVVSTQLEAVLNSNRRLESEVEALRQEVGELRQLPAAAVTKDSLPTPGGAGSRGASHAPDEPAAVEGPFVRAARWLERRLRGGRG